MFYFLLTLDSVTMTTGHPAMAIVMAKYVHTRELAQPRRAGGLAAALTV